MISQPLIIELKGILQEQGINLEIAEVTEVANTLVGYVETLMKIDQQTKIKMNKEITHNDYEKNTQSKPAENLYLQVWRNPIFYGGLLAILKPAGWHTLAGLAVFINEKGECNPKLDRLAPLLGLNNIASVSRRISSLEKKSFNGKPILVVERQKKQTEKGNWIYTNNRYYLNPEIVSIFNRHPTTLVYRELQMKEFLKTREKLVKSFSMNPKRVTNNITRTIS